MKKDKIIMIKVVDYGFIEYTLFNSVSHITPKIKEEPVWSGHFITIRDEGIAEKLKKEGIKKARENGLIEREILYDKIYAYPGLDERILELVASERWNTLKKEYDINLLLKVIN
jgi:hypothetical protein